MPPGAGAEDGLELFKRNCQTCHSIEKNALPRQGPTLSGVIGRKAGTVEGFKYSDGLKVAGWVWTAEKLDEWITFPKKDDTRHIHELSPERSRHSKGHHRLHRNAKG